MLRVNFGNPRLTDHRRGLPRPSAKGVSEGRDLLKTNQPSYLGNRQLFIFKVTRRKLASHLVENTCESRSFGGKAARERSRTEVELLSYLGKRRLAVGQQGRNGILDHDPERDISLAPGGECLLAEFDQDLRQMRVCADHGQPPTTGLEHDAVLCSQELGSA